MALFACLSQYVWSQASTEGKEFWLASTIICQPPTASKAAVPYIAVSAQKACTVYIYDYQGNKLAQADVADGSWTEFGNTYNTNTGAGATTDDGPINYYLDPDKWYPNTNVISASDVYKHADKTNNFGLHITATENISVFVIIRATNSMDASNILPITALKSEYYTQDYWPFAKDVSPNVTMTTILATEDNTIVEITPNGNTYGKSNAKTTFNVTLNQGQTYYLMSADGEQLTGTHIKASDDKPIAVYNGSPLTTIPNKISARDGLYEQSMPVDYWGTQFVVTRSMHKDGNIIGITATENGTWVKIDGYERATLKAGETYYFMLQSQYDPNSKKPGEKPIKLEDVITADVVYVETRCPVAVFSYDTGNAFVYSGKSQLCGDDVTENENMGCGDDRLGDPASVWISPIQQKIKQITFGACYTDKTQMHYLNVVTETATRDSTKLYAYYQDTPLDRTSYLQWQTVESNPKYSYARILLTDHNEEMRVFTLKNPSGFIAHIYGNGDDEAYAYSVGSAAVEQGVIMDGETFTNGIRSDTKFCIGTEFVFDSRVGTDEVTRVDWDFGDGITEYNGEPVTTHTYTTPGWYDAKAKLFGHQACADESEQDLGTVSFTFRVWQHDTIIVPPSQDDKICFDTLQIEQFIQEDKMDSIMALIANGNRQIINPDAPCYEDRKISLVPYGMDTKYEYTPTPGHDSIYVNRKWYYPETLPEDGIIKWEEDNHYGCDSFITCHAKIITCLDLAIEQEPQHACLGDNTLTISYTKTKGDIEGNAVFTIDELPSFREEIVIDNKNIQDGEIYLPIANLTEPGYYHATIIVKDSYCTEKVEENTFRIPLTVYYPENIFKIKFGNTLAVYAPGNEGNKGYTFTGFQWYRNGKAILGATNAVYTSETQFEKDDEYYVMLTNDRNETLPSCAQTIEGNGQASAPNKAPAAQKKIVNQRIRIVIDNRVYDMYGQRVE